MSKIQLKRLAVIEGDLYHPGIYKPGELPPQIVSNPDLVDKVVTGKDKSVTEFDNSLKVQKINLGEEVSNINAPGYKGQETVILESEKENKVFGTEKVAKDSKINLNTATLDEIAGINGVTMPTAQKIVEQRETDKFKDLSDLETRASLPGKKKWESLKNSIAFE